MLQESQFLGGLQSFQKHLKSNKSYAKESTFQNGGDSI